MPKRDKKVEKFSARAVAFGLGVPEPHSRLPLMMLMVAPKVSVMLAFWSI